MKKIILAAAIAALTATPALAATDTGSATANVVAPITLTHDVGAVLDFGTFAPAAGQMVVTTAGAVGAGSLTQLGTVAADSFTVGGDANRGFSISATGGTISNGTSTMSFTTDYAAGGTLDGSGAASFSVGGTLSVAGTETAGTYTGTYNATVEYN